ncbi:MAG TPA: pitrilysin family protein [Candidatus Polarisedimenticolia bacterium]|nr:pitrilysin family protein [Candidatus Polarisedimenticolia bacterium]
MAEERVTREVLPNGLTVLVAEDPSSPVAAINLWVQAGYFDETDEEIGISHVIEHMFFKGTTARPRPDQNATELKALGGETNAGTYYESTNYHVILPADRFEAALAIQADALTDPLFDADELKREKEAVLQEARRKLDTPQAYALEMLYREAFDVHRIRRWRIGTEEGIRALTREQLVSYYRRHYVPGRIVLAIAGGVPEAKAFAAARHLFGGIPGGEGDVLGSPAEPLRSGFRAARLTGDIRRGQIILGFRSVPILSDDDPALRVLAHVLGGGRASRLHQAVKERDGLVDAIGSGVEAFRDLGIFTVHIEGDPKLGPPALRSTIAEIERLRTEPPSAAEIERARTAIEFRYHASRSEALGRSAILAYYESLGGYGLAEESMKRMLAVTASDVRRVAEATLDIRNATLLEYLPEAGAPAMVPAAEARLQDLLRVEAGPALKDPLATRAGAPVPAGPPPLLRLSPLPPAGSVTRRRFESGPLLVHEERRDQPLVTLCVTFRGGRSGEQREQSGITRLMQAALLKGSPSRDARRVAVELDSLGTAIERVVDEDYFGFALGVLARHAGKGFEILMDLVRRPVFAYEEIEKERALLLAAQESIRDQSLPHTFQLFRQAAFGSHPYALPAFGLTASVQSLRREDLVRWHRLTIRPASMIVTIVGALGPTEAADLVGQAIAEWPQDGFGGSEPGALLPWGAAEVVETRRRAQTAQIIGFPTPGVQSPERHALDIVQSVTSGLGGRFFEAVRGKRGLAYAVQSFNFHRLRGGAFLTYLGTSPRDEAEARRVLFQEIATLRHDGPRRDEIERARRHLVGGHAISLQGNGSRALRYADAEVRGLGAEAVVDYARRIAAVVDQDVGDAIWRYVDPDRCALGILRGEAPASNS